MCICACGYVTLWDYVTVRLIYEITSLAARSMSVQNRPTHSCRGAKAACYGICNVEKKGAEDLKTDGNPGNTKKYYLFLPCAGFR